MPTYAYRCDSGHDFEVVQGITEASLEKCPECGAAVRRVFFPVGVVFKGQGFYKTDSRSSSTATAGSAPAPAAASSASGGDGAKAASKAESPAAGKSAAKTDSASAGSASKGAS